MTKRVYVFDVDGVVFDSNGAKIKAYQEVLSQVATADELKLLTNNFRLNFGKTRLWHMEFASNFLDRDVDPYDLSVSYGEVISCVEFEVIESNAARIRELSGDKPIFVSGSSREELVRILPRHFACNHGDIYGAPETKINVLCRLKKTMAEHQLLYFGDSVSDLQACEAVGIDFVGLHGFSAHEEQLMSAAKLKGVRCIKNLEYFYED